MNADRSKKLAQDGVGVFVFPLIYLRFPAFRIMCVYQRSVHFIVNLCLSVFISGLYYLRSSAFRIFCVYQRSVLSYCSLRPVVSLKPALKQLLHHKQQDGEKHCRQDQVEGT
jgi:hypothetical protein